MLQPGFLGIDVNLKSVRDFEYPQNMPFSPEAQSLLMRAAIAAGAAAKRLSDERGVFHLTPSEWAELESAR
ncbi:hypothetical protein HMPREF0578_1440 [Mobiluncus mulieris 28-1]|uniref:Cutinase n=1 Tax=Mobiluncus mulieris TaxID=2052 RepID=A0A2X1RTS1_9ACTO|nr:hypothetical protein [Mobiluncus mulieris]EEJ52813.1 hypothetical protein HMPREF0577_2126 [Mobiluncus mulieris ATCC 35243]EEZ92110.1 hypothetical protein HMPREF0578_1440 [Mobiluncus mulieris 28-1]EFN94139.1 hypothetical protein HMPREF9278_0542 [Mobiluncus mulieris FB024-16]MBB5847100.1 hypothetical protein [Mobiluncus mulieris]MCU9967997.1 cutinase [Mobiluncus mulieris]